MTARMRALLYCDHDGCTAVFEYLDASGPRWKPPKLADARRSAHLDGWRHGVRLRADSGPAPSFDYCPTHAGDVAAIREVTPCHERAEESP